MDGNKAGVYTTIISQLANHETETVIALLYDTNVVNPDSGLRRRSETR